MNDSKGKYSVKIPKDATKEEIEAFMKEFKSNWGKSKPKSRGYKKQTADGLDNQGRQRPGRNEPCDCGSKRKSKKCCYDVNVQASKQDEA